MELTPRLRTIAELVPKGAIFSDIGTDHAYLPTWLLLNGVINKAIAADINEGPLDRARETAKKYHVENNVDFRLCDGLTDIQEGETDAIAIAGMGGDTIAHILGQAPWTKDPRITLLLQPMTSQKDLRQWLFQNGYCIVREQIVREGEKLYTILLVRGGTMNELTQAELWAGKQSCDPLRGEFLDHIMSKVSKALSGHRSASHPNDEIIRYLEQILFELNNMKEEWSTWQQ